MASMKPRGNAKDFWNTIKAVSIAEIVRQAQRPICLALVGDREQRGAIRIALYSHPPGKGSVGEALALPIESFIEEFDTTETESGFPQNPNLFDVVIDVGGGRTDAPPGARIYSVNEIGGWDATVLRILEDRPDIALALARNFPVFRPKVAEDIISVTAIANAQFALVTGITAAFPLLSFLLPVNGLSDMLMLTKNQVMMTLKLAAVYGLELDYKSRLKEVAPILVNAFGWRAVARELVGAIPVIGMVTKAGISYAGTVTVGKTAQKFYESGEKISGEQIKRWYSEALQSSKEKIRALAKTTVRRRRTGSVPALPSGEETLMPSNDYDIVDTEFAKGD